MNETKTTGRVMGDAANSLLDIGILNNPLGHLALGRLGCYWVGVGNDVGDYYKTNKSCITC